MVRSLKTKQTRLVFGWRTKANLPNASLAPRKHDTRGKIQRGAWSDHDSCIFFSCSFALWARSSKNPDVSTGPLTRLFTRSLTPLTPALVLHCLLRSCAPLRSFTLLTLLLVGQWVIGWILAIYSAFLSILAHSARQSFVVLFYFKGRSAKTSLTQFRD